MVQLNSIEHVPAWGTHVTEEIRRRGITNATVNVAEPDQSEHSMNGQKCAGIARALACLGMGCLLSSDLTAAVQRCSRRWTLRVFRDSGCITPSRQCGAGGVQRSHDRLPAGTYIMSCMLAVC